MSLSADVDEVGLSSRLLFALPLLRSLIQSVAESDGEENTLRLTSAAGACVTVARRAGQETMTISIEIGADGGAELAGAIGQILVAHGFALSLGQGTYQRQVGFESDVAFEDAARLIIGTFQHAWGVNLRECVRVDLSLSLPPEGWSDD